MMHTNDPREEYVAREMIRMNVHRSVVAYWIALLIINTNKGDM